MLAGCALIGGLAPRDVIDWQPASAAIQPWRALTAVGVHYSSLHLIGNLAGCVLAGALGWAAQVPTRMAAAWLAAWPLTQIALLIRPDLHHYGGLSGVLHAGVAIVAVWLLATARTFAQRGVAAAVALGLGLKVVSESPWGPALRHSNGWDISVAPIAHATGVLAGLACAGAALALRRFDSTGRERRQ